MKVRKCPKCKLIQNMKNKYCQKCWGYGKAIPTVVAILKDGESIEKSQTIPEEMP